VTTLLELLDASLTADEDALVQKIIDALPVCPACATWTDDENCCLPGQPCRICGVDADGNPCDSPICPDCTDGRMDVFRALAIARAVMETTYDHLAWTTDQVKAGQYDPHPIIASLRAVKP